MLLIVYAVYVSVGSGPHTVPTQPVVPVTWIPILNLPPSNANLGPNCAKSFIDDWVKPVIKNGTVVLCEL